MLLLATGPHASALGFGMMWTGDYGQAESEMDVVARSGAGFFRMPLDISKTPKTGGGYDWSQVDPIFKAAWENGVTVLPGLVRSNGEGTRFLTSSDPAWSEWWSWSKAAVERYGAGGAFWKEKSNPRPVTAWEVWNEPNLPNNNPQLTKATCEANGWTPRYNEDKTFNNCVQPERYGSFLSYTASAVQAGQKALTGGTTGVLFGGLYMPGGEFFNSFLEDAASVSGVPGSYQGVSIHPYAFSGGVSQMASQIEEVRYALDNHVTGAAGTSLWITELGWPVAGEGKPTVSEAQQAALLNESFNWVKANAGKNLIDIVTWYNLRDLGHASWDYHCGLRDQAGQYRSSWFAFQKQTGAAAWPGPPAQTGSASGVTATEATLNGTVNPAGYSTSYFFEYGTTTAYDTLAPMPAATTSAASATAVSTTVKGIQPGTTYHYRLVASHAGGRTYGEDRTFTVPAHRYMGGISNGAGTAASWGALLNQGLSPEPLSADFNGDGKADLIGLEFAGGTSHRIRVGLSSGSGVSGWFTAMGGLGWPERMDAGDFNADGKADVLAVEPDGSGKYRYMLGISSGTGISSWTQVLSGMGLPERVSVGDVTGDGKADIVSVEPDGSGKYRYMLGISSGTAISSWTQVLGGMGLPYKTEVGDFTGDGKADIVSVEESSLNTYRYMLGVSAGTSVSSWAVVLPGMAFPYRFDLGDLNADGKADIVALESEGTGTYRYMTGMSNGSGVSSGWTKALGGMALARKMTLADFTGDGKDDIVSIETEPTGAQSYRLGVSSGTAISSWELLQTSMAAPAGSDSGDFNGDNKADVVSLESDGGTQYRYRVGLSDGSSAFTSWKTALSGMGLPTSWGVADFTGDGKADVVSVEPDGSGKYRYMLGVSSGTAISSWTQILGGMGQPSRFALGDFTGDGKADIVSVEPDGSGKYRYMLGISSGTSVSSWAQVLGGMGLPTRVSVGDITGNGKADIVALEPDGSGKYRYMLGVSSGTGVSSWAQVLGGMGTANFMDTADYTGDGKADVVSVEPDGSGKYRYMLGVSSGTGISSWAQVLGGMGLPAFFSLGDLNADGRADLVSVEKTS